MHSQLGIEVCKRIEAMRVVEATLILTVAALYLAIVTGRVGTNQLVPNAQLCGGPLKERDQFTVGLCKAVSKLKPVVSLDTFDGEAVHMLSSKSLPRNRCSAPRKQPSTAAVRTRRWQYIERIAVQPDSKSAEQP